MKLGPKTLELFSARAQGILRRVDRRAPPPRSDIARRLAAAGRPVLDAAIELERRFGGVTLRLGLPGEKQSFKLGIEWHEPRPDPADPHDPERTMVPIGSGWNGHETLFMNDRGEVISHFDTVIMKSSSIVRYIEQLVIGLTPRWRPPSCAIDLRPALGARLADALGLRRVDEVSDEYVEWWRGGGLFLQQVLFPDSWKAAQTSVYARSVGDAARALEAAAALDPKLVVQVGSNPIEQKHLTRKQRERAPKIESWATRPGARRYRFGTEAQYMTGAVWVIEEGGAPTIQQYRVYADEDGEELLAWDTFTEKGGVSRDMEE